MITSLSINSLTNYTSRQLNYFYPDDDLVELKNFNFAVKTALERLEFCFNKVILKTHNDGTNALFNHLQSDHYMMYLWYLGNEIWNRKQDKKVCNKLYYLNKSLHAIDCMYDTKLPNIFLLFHGAGTMLGKATYDDYFVVLQGCTVGNNRGIYPVIQKGVALTAHASIIGNCTIGNRVTVSSYTNIVDTSIASNTVVFKDSTGKINLKPTTNSFAQSFFSELIPND